jgi:hypothetical protein
MTTFPRPLLETYCDAIPLANAQYGGVNVRGAGFQCTVRICNGTAGIVMEMCLYVATNDASKCPDEIVLVYS